MAALSSLPTMSTRKKHSHRVRDRQVSSLCHASRIAFLQWKQAGRPLSGMLHDARKKAKRAVKQHLTLCRTRAERHRLQKHDKLFRNHDNHRFHLATMNQEKRMHKALRKGKSLPKNCCHAGRSTWK